MDLSTIVNKDFKRRAVRTRDRHSRTRNILYGNEIAQIVYGKKELYRKSTDTSNPKKLRKLGMSVLESQKRKAKELLSAVSSPNPNWAYATEIFVDLQDLSVQHLFPRRSDYVMFLTDLGSVIKQKLPIQAKLIEYSQRIDAEPFTAILGYEIKPYQASAT